MKEWNSSQTFILEYNLQWFAKDGPGGEKTEPATAKKLQDARKDGKVVKSKELTFAVDLIVLFLAMKIFMGYVAERFFSDFAVFYNKVPDVVKENNTGMTSQSAAAIMNEAIIHIILTILPFFLIGVIVSFLINLLQVGWKVTSKPMKPDLKKFNPINGFKRMFSKDSLFELFKSIVKIGLIVYIAYSAVKGHRNELFMLYDIPLIQSIVLMGTIIMDTGLRISLVYLVLGIVDWIYQKHKFKEDMKMTKQEVKDEYKNTEGNPEIKGRQRQRMREASQRRMMQDVPKADVVITNPTHYAVAIRYDSEVSKAPVVVAKGEDYLAQKIKEVAREAKVEIVENKPLARMLYANVNVGAEIPPELYQAVAEVLAMVYNLKNRR